ncbi:hypothetical protein JCM5296_000437 [Sporobolomyces johnsonii]
MASSSPPPPPDPPHFTPLKSGCNSRPSLALRRAKTLASPESPTTWRREPLVDVTNEYVGRETGGRLQVRFLAPSGPKTAAFWRRASLSRPTRPNPPSPAPFQRVPLVTPPRLFDTIAATPSPTPSRIPRRTALRRTRSEVLPSPSTSLDLFGPAALPSEGLGSSPLFPTRELRPRVRPSSEGEGSPAGSSSPSVPRAPVAGTRRTRTSSTSAPSRRRTFGGLSVLAEDPQSDAEPAGDDDARSVSSENEGRRRLRRRRTTDGAGSSVVRSGLR